LSEVLSLVYTRKEAFQPPREPSYPPWYPGIPPCRICLSLRCYLRSPERLVLHTVDHVYRHVHLSGCGKCTFNTRVEERKPLRRGKRASSPQE